MGNLTDIIGDDFNPDDHKGRDFDLIPPGEYVAIIANSQLKSTKKGNGTYVEFEIQIVGEKFKGRKLWSNVNIVNQNEIAVRIGKETLSAMCAAVGLRSLKDTSELHNRPLIIKIAIGHSEWNASGKENTIKGYRSATPAAQIAQTETTTIPKDPAVVDPQAAAGKARPF